ncbi:TasA family protein [Alicyclobacillus ferrooxydans]|uniref:TasA family protein n=1 Tax=Alicyclobacillus ferrooxydans TaxID=471514 RepID=UPI0006D56A7D|nr:TasA family protein [Alicyclobacillus ferrooxydans]
MGLKTKLAMAVATSAAGAAMIAGGTFAYFSSTQQSTGNTFATGTITLGMDVNGSAASNANFTLSNKIPGDSFSIPITLTNSGTHAAGHTYLSFSTTSETGASGSTFNPVSDDINTQLTVDSVTVNGRTITLPSSIKTIQDLENYGKVDLGSLASGATDTVTVSGHFMNAPTAQNQYQGVTATYEVDGELTQ